MKKKKNQQRANKHLSKYDKKNKEIKMQKRRKWIIDKHGRNKI